MYKKLVTTENMSYEDWLQNRRIGIGGSDASAICGVNKYKTTLEVWMDKLGLSEGSESSEAAYWGTVMEPIIREEFSRRTGLTVLLEKSILQSTENPFMIANLDGIIEDPQKGKCIFEAKTASTYKATEWENGIPDEYLIQVQHYLAVTGFSGAYIAVLIGGNSFKYDFIQRDEALIEMLIKIEKDFWDLVLAKTQPELDGSESAKKILDTLFPVSYPTTTELPTEAIDLVHAFEYYQQEENRVSELKEEACNKLKSLLGDNESAKVDDKIVIWKSVTSERIDSKLLKSEAPDIFSKYAKNSSYRRFSVKTKSA